MGETEEEMQKKAMLKNGTTKKVLISHIINKLCLIEDFGDFDLKSVKKKPEVLLNEVYLILNII